MAISLENLSLKLASSVKKLKVYLWFTFKGVMNWLYYSVLFSEVHL